MRMLSLAVALLLTAGLAHAQDAKLPDGLRHVPADALGFVHIRVGEFLKSEVGKALLDEVRKDKEAAKGLKKFEQTLGIAASDIESVTVLMLTPPLRSQLDFMDRGRAPAWGRPWNKRADDEMKKPIFLPPPKAFEDKKEVDEKKKDVDDKKPDAKESPVIFQKMARPHGDDLDDDFPEFGFMGPLVIVTSTKDIDRKKILRAQIFPSGPRDPYGRSDNGASVLFLSDRSVLMGAPWDLGRYSEAMARTPKTKPMASALALAEKPHLVVAGGHVPAEVRRMMFAPFGGDMRELAAISPLLQTEAGMALDLDKNFELALQFNAPTEASAANALQAVKSLRVLAELAIEKGREQGESGGWKLALENAVIKALADATIEQKGLSVRASFKMDVNPSVVKHFTKEIVATFRQKGDRTRSSNNLKQIGIALHTYHDANKQFPPAGIGNRDGKPLLSWRVAILPYIEQQALYQQFDLTQPWDHPTNKKLIEKMPATFEIPGLDTKEGMTHYRVLVGGGAMFDARMPIRLAQVTDGLSNTFMVVEAADPTIWTRPDDLPYNPKGPLPKLGVSPDGFNALFGDGTVRFMSAKTPAEILHAYITRAGGEVIPLPDEKVLPR